MLFTDDNKVIYYFVQKRLFIYFFSMNPANILRIKSYSICNIGYVLEELASKVEKITQFTSQMLNAHTTQYSRLTLADHTVYFLFMLHHSYMLTVLLFFIITNIYLLCFIYTVYMHTRYVRKVSTVLFYQHRSTSVAVLHMRTRLSGSLSFD